MLSEPIYCFGCDFTCYSIAVIKWLGFHPNINQVLDIKFMHICCNWTNNWLVHVTSTQMNFGLLLHVPCTQSWSRSHTLVLLNCESLTVFRATSSQSKCVMACPCSPSELDRSWLQYVVIQQQLLTEELFSQLPMYLLLRHFCNNKMKRRLSTWLLHKLNFEF